MKVNIYEQTNERSRYICNAFMEGVKKSGDTPALKRMLESSYTDNKAPWTILYGQSQGGKEIIKSVADEDKHSLYIDMGYWKRKPVNNPYAGYHKVSLDTIHPTKQLDFKVDDVRLRRLGVEITKQKRGDCILLAGLNIKAAVVNDLDPYEWEKKYINLIRQHTDRPIIYRPKPSWKGARPLPGTIFSPGTEPLEKVLAKTHCVVTRHSNVSIDAMAVGIPSFTEDGVARDLCLNNIADIENAEPPTVEEIFNLFCKIAYCQWNLEEMKTGEAWRWFRDNVEG